MGASTPRFTLDGLVTGLSTDGPGTGPVING